MWKQTLFISKISHSDFDFRCQYEIEIFFRYNYEGKYLDAQELKDFLEKEQMVDISILKVVSFLLYFFFSVTLSVTVISNSTSIVPNVNTISSNF